MIDLEYFSSKLKGPSLENGWTIIKYIILDFISRNLLFKL